MTTSLTMTNLDPDAPPAAWSLTELLTLVTAMVGQREPLLEQKAGLQLQLHGGELSGQRLIGGLASSGSALLGVVVPLLVGMLGRDAQVFDFLGREWRRSPSSRRQRCPNRRRSRMPNSFGENGKRLDPLASTARHCRSSGGTRSKTGRPMALVQHRSSIAGMEALPTVCPKCKSPYWNRPRQNEPPPKPAAKSSAPRSRLSRRDDHRRVNAAREC
jgi:hypothetical protein